MQEIIRKMAHLARLSFPKEELERYTQKAQAVLKYVEQLNELDTSGIEPMSHAIEVTGSPREDSEKQPQDSKGIIANAPEMDGKYYQVPRVIEES